jgi:hypothetical protein
MERPNTLKNLKRKLAAKKAVITRKRRNAAKKAVKTRKRNKELAAGDRNTQ